MLWDTTLPLNVQIRLRNEVELYPKRNNPKAQLTNLKAPYFWWIWIFRNLIYLAENGEDVRAVVNTVNELSASVKCGEFLDQLRDYSLLNNDHVHSSKYIKMIYRFDMHFIYTNEKTQPTYLVTCVCRNGTHFLSYFMFVSKKINTGKYGLQRLPRRVIIHKTDYYNPVVKKKLPFYPTHTWRIVETVNDTNI
jgi:hypothetical protein